MNGKPRCLALKNQFFKALINDFATRLLIPEAFIEEIQEEFHGSAILQGPTGNCWPVNLNRTSKGTYLEGGWETFVKDHSLTEGGFLVFNYVGSMHFDVQILGRHVFVQEGAFPVQPSVGLTCRQLKGKTQSPQGDAGKKTSTSKPEALGGKKTSTSKLKALGGKVNKAARRFTFSLGRPNFLIQMKHYCLHTQLFVPASFAREHLRETKPMILRNVSGSKVRNVEYTYGWPGTSRISCGWRLFASANHIKEGDSCVFELVQENTLEVHSFRC